MAPTSQSGFRPENDRMGPECPGGLRSGFRGEFRAVFCGQEGRLKEIHVKFTSFLARRFGVLYCQKSAQESAAARLQGRRSGT